MPNINYPIEKKLFKKLKKLADTHFSNNEINFDDMRDMGNNFYSGGYQIDHYILSEITRLVNVYLSSHNLREITSSSVNLINSFGITHHTDQDKKSIMIITGGRNYVFAYHQDRAKRHEMANCHTVAIGETVFFRSDEYHSLYAYRPVKKPLECILICLDK